MHQCFLFLESKQPIDHLDSSGGPKPDKKPAAESSDDLKPQETPEVPPAKKPATSESHEDGFGLKKPKEEGVLVCTQAQVIYVCV